MPRNSTRGRPWCERLEVRCLLSASNPTDLTPVADQLYFVADDGVHGRELFVTDATAEGTHIVRDIRPGSDGSAIRSLTPFGDRLLFTADDGSHGVELWMTDGTSQGTFLVKDIHRGTGSGFPLGLAVVDGVAYFAAGTKREGRELWRSDGTEAGTRLVADLSSGSASSRPSGFTEVNGTILFTADVTSESGSGRRRQTVYLGRELWRTDGTSAGTALVKDINPGFSRFIPVELRRRERHAVLLGNHLRPEHRGLEERRHDTGDRAPQGREPFLQALESD